MEFNGKHNDSLIDIENYMQGVMPASPLKRSSEGSIRAYNFRRGPSSVDLMKQESGVNRKAKQKWKVLSNSGIVFLVLALLQVVVIAGLQIAIAVLGDFNGGQLEEYVDCVIKDFNSSNRTLPANSTFPSFGSDKQVYVYIFIFLAIYNFGLCLYALLAQRIVEVGSFVGNNLILVIFGSVQVYQFRGFSEEFCDPITLVGWLALANVVVVFLFNVMFCILAVEIYVEFGWKVYKFVNCNPALRFYYRNYEIFLSILKGHIVFTIAFLVGQAALILPLNDYEFWITFPFIIAMVCMYIYAFPIVRRESHIGFMTLLTISLLLIGYFTFKLYRYITRSCPVCRELDRELIDRREDFQHLIILTSINILITLVYLLALVRVWTQFGKGLADHFYIHGHWFDRILRKKPPEEAFLNSVGTGKIVKQKSNAAALLIKFKQNPESPDPPPDIKRNSSLDERDYSEYIFTPSTEFKSLALSSNGSPNDVTERSEVGRTKSLPPILEDPSAVNKFKKS